MIDITVGNNGDYNNITSAIEACKDSSELVNLRLESDFVLREQIISAGMRLGHISIVSDNQEFPITSYSKDGNYTVVKIDSNDFSEGDYISITGSTNYNTGHKVLSVIGDYVTIDSEYLGNDAKGSAKKAHLISKGECTNVIAGEDYAMGDHRAIFTAKYGGIGPRVNTLFHMDSSSDELVIGFLSVGAGSGIEIGRASGIIGNTHRGACALFTGSIVAEDSVFRDSNGKAVNANSGGVITATGADVRNSSIGIQAEYTGIVNAMLSRIGNCSKGVLVKGAGMANVQSSKITRCYTGIYGSTAGTINAQGSGFYNCAIGVYGNNGATLNANSSIFSKNTKRAVFSRNGSPVNVSGSTYIGNKCDTVVMNKGIIYAYDCDCTTNTTPNKQEEYGVIYK